MSGKGIPFLDLITPHVDLQEELMEAVRDERTQARIGQMLTTGKPLRN